MSLINQHALDAIRTAALTGPNIAAQFERMAVGAQGVGSSGGMFILSYLDPEQLPEEGELVPVITLSLKPFTTRRQAPRLIDKKDAPAK
jgi:hypothetical protein